MNGVSNVFNPSCFTGFFLCILVDLSAELTAWVNKNDFKSAFLQLVSIICSSVGNGQEILFEQNLSMSWKLSTDIVIAEILSLHYV